MKIDRNSFSFGSGVSSMTGFGRSEKNYPGVRIAVEIRTVNNRFCDIGMKISRDLNPLETEIREMIRSKLNRGRINLLITLDRDVDENILQIDTESANACYRRLTELNKEIGCPGDVTLGQLLHFSDFFTKLPDRVLTDDLKKQVFECLNEALDDLSKMRRNEGVSLAKDLLERIEQVESARRKVVKLAADQPKLQMEKMHERLDQLVSSGPIDPGRLEQELAIMADRLDITEECVRLESHIHRFTESLSGDEPVGKKLGFLIQELNREANTISSKSALAEITHLAMNMKEEIERMREQVQNLE